MRVVIPARDEQARISACLGSVRLAIAELHRSNHALIDVQVAVVLDRCTDRTADIIAECHPEVDTVLADVGNVGAARRLGTRRLLSRVAGHGGVWLANTDADSVVPHDWLTHMIGQAQRGADLVLGTVEPDVAAGARLRQAWKDRHDTSDGHRHVHGANLGIRARTYHQLGGWPSRPSGEDEALVHAAEALGAVRIARTGAIPVITSSRLAGRAPDGFARYLRVMTDELGRESLFSAG